MSSSDLSVRRKNKSGKEGRKYRGGAGSGTLSTRVKGEDAEKE